MLRETVDRQGVRQPMAHPTHRPRPRVTHRRGPSALALLVGLAVLTGACEFSFGGRTLDTDTIENEIAQGIEEQTGISVQSVECPDDVDAEAGNTFRCTATADDGSTAPVRVTQQDDEGNVEWELESEG